MSLFARFTVLQLLILVILLLAGQTALGQPAASDEPASSRIAGSSDELSLSGEITWGRALILKLRQGGITILFLLAVSVMALASTLERLIHLRAGKIAPSNLATRMSELCRKGQSAELKQLAQASDSTLGRVVLAMVQHGDSSAGAVSTIAEDISTREMKLHLLRAYPLMVCATISPLLGLFGTVAGMIDAFDKVAAAGSLGDASMLGGDISKALITTAAGLVVAIPSLGLYHFFRSRTTLMAITLEEKLSHIFSVWNDNRQLAERK